VNVSNFIVELFELSGLSEHDFCQKLDIDAEQLAEIKAGKAPSGSACKMLLKAVSVALFSKKTNCDLDEVHDELTKARAIIVTVGESSHLAEHHQDSLSAAAEMIDNSRQRISS